MSQLLRNESIFVGDSEPLHLKKARRVFLRTHTPPVRAMAVSTLTVPPPRISHPRLASSRTFRLVPGDDLSYALREAEVFLRSGPFLIELEPGRHAARGARVPSNVAIRGLGLAVIEGSLVVAGDNVTLADVSLESSAPSSPLLFFAPTAGRVTLENVTVESRTPLKRGVQLVCNGVDEAPPKPPAPMPGARTPKPPPASVPDWSDFELVLKGVNRFVAALPDADTPLASFAGGRYVQFGALEVGRRGESEQGVALCFKSPESVQFDGTLSAFGSVFLTGAAKERDAPVQFRDVIVRQARSELPPVALLGAAGYQLAFNALTAYRKEVATAAVGIVTAYESMEGFPEKLLDDLTDSGSHISIGVACAPTDGAYTYPMGATNVREGEGASFALQQLNQPPADD